jgi:small subunit ribosomal protein S1
MDDPDRNQEPLQPSSREPEASPENVGEGTPTGALDVEGGTPETEGGPPEGEEGSPTVEKTVQAQETPTSPVTGPGEPENQQPPDADQPTGEGDFAALLKAGQTKEPQDPQPGDRVTGTLVQIGEVECFVDCGGRSELPIATKELQDSEGHLKHQVGEAVSGYVQKIDGELRLTCGLDTRAQSMALLEQAYQDQTPLAGIVRGTNRGGYTIDLGGRRAFCPHSQMDLHRVEDPQSFVGLELPFRIIELSEEGKNIVLSRRAVLEADRREVAAETRSSLAVGDVREGTVTRLVPFGAFVDLGGVEGLVHISQISHQRVEKPESILKAGQKVKVKVLEMQNLGESRRERISLSMKALATDPWPASAEKIKVGDELIGRVTRLTNFGAFVEILPGIEGLVHISELSYRRVLHPREVVSENQEIPVRILDVDLDRRRISLSLKQSTQWEDQ